MNFKATPHDSPVSYVPTGELIHPGVQGTRELTNLTPENPKWFHVLGSHDSLESLSVTLNLQAHATAFKATLVQKTV